MRRDQRSARAAPRPARGREALRAVDRAARARGVDRDLDPQPRRDRRLRRVARAGERRLRDLAAGYAVPPSRQRRQAPAPGGAQPGAAHRRAAPGEPRGGARVSRAAARRGAGHARARHRRRQPRAGGAVRLERRAPRDRAPRGARHPQHRLSRLPGRPSRASPSAAIDAARDRKLDYAARTASTRFIVTAVLLRPGRDRRLGRAPPRARHDRPAARRRRRHRDDPHAPRLRPALRHRELDPRARHRADLAPAPPHAAGAGEGGPSVAAPRRARRSPACTASRSAASPRPRAGCSGSRRGGSGSTMPASPSKTDPGTSRRGAIPRTIRDPRGPSNTEPRRQGDRP